MTRKLLMQVKFGANFVNRYELCALIELNMRLLRN